MNQQYAPSNSVKLVQPALGGRRGKLHPLRGLAATTDGLE
jgi:hypothetical protein